jgi:hypothetical protein
VTDLETDSITEQGSLASIAVLTVLKTKTTVEWEEVSKSLPTGVCISSLSYSRRFPAPEPYASSQMALQFLF